ADSVLSAAISAEVVNRANAVDAAVMAVVGGAPSTLDTLAEISALLSTGSIMHSMMDRVSAAVATDTAARTASILELENAISASKVALEDKDAALSAGLTANAASRTAGIASLASALSLATASLSGTDSTLSAALFNNAASRTSEVASLASALSAAKASLSGTDSAVSGTLFNNTASRTAAVASLAASLQAAELSLSGVDSAISAALFDNAAIRAASIASLASSLSAAASLLTDSDSVLSAAISAESGNMTNAVTTAVMAVVGGAPSTLDTLAELSALLSTGSVMHSMMDSVSAAVANNTATRTADIQGLNNSITAKELSFVAADAALSAALSNNIVSRSSGVASVSTALAAAALSLTNVDSTISAAISANVTQRSSAVTSLTTLISEAAASHSAVDSTLSAALSTNVSGRASDIALLTSSLSTAAASLSAVDSTLSATLYSNTLSRVSEHASLSTALSSHAHSLQTMDAANSATFFTLSSGTQLALLADTTLVNNTIAGVVGAAPSTLDTLGEIASALNNGTDVVTALTGVLNNKAGATQVASLGVEASALADQTSLTALETATGTKAAASTVTLLQSTVTALGSACSSHTSDVSLMQSITGVTTNSFNLFTAAASNLDKLYRYLGYVNADNTVKYKINNLADPALQSSSLVFEINGTTNALTAVKQVATVTFDPLQTDAKYTVRAVETPITVTNGTYTFTVSSTGVADYTANATAIVVTGQESALRLAPLNALTIPKLALSGYTYATPTVQTPYAATTWNDVTGQITQALTFNYELGTQRVKINGTNYDVAGTASILYSLTYVPGTTGSITAQVLNSTSKLESAVLTLSNVYNDYAQYAPPTLVDGSKTLSLSGSTYTYSATFTSDATVVELHAYDAGTSTYSNVQNITSSGNSLFAVSRTYDVSRIGQPLFKLKAATNASASKRASNFTSVVNAEVITFSQPVQSSVSYTTLSPGSYRLSATYAVHSMASAVKVSMTTGATLIASQAASSGSATFTLDFTESQVTNGMAIVVTTLANSYGLQSSGSVAYVLLGQYAEPVIVAGTKVITLSGSTYTYTANYTSASTAGIKVYDSAGAFVSTATTPGSGTFTVSFTHDASKIGQTAFKLSSNATSTTRESALINVSGEDIPTFAAPVISGSVSYVTVSAGSHKASMSYTVNARVSAVSVLKASDSSVIAGVVSSVSGGVATISEVPFTDAVAPLGIVVVAVANTYGKQSAASATQTLLGQHAVPVIVAGTKSVVASGADYAYTANYTSASTAGIKVYDSAGAFVSTATTPGSGTFTVSFTYAANKIGQTAFNITSNADASKRESALLAVVGETTTNTIRGLTLGPKSVYSAVALPSVSTLVKPTYGSTWATVGSVINAAAAKPSAVAMSADGSVIAVGYPDSNAVYVYKKNVSNQWVQLGNVINGPATLTNTRFGSYVSMSANGRTLAIGTNKEGYRTIGGTTASSANGQFNTPIDIALDASGNFYVCEQYNHRIQKFTKEGAFILQFGSYGSSDGQFNSPNGITIDYNGYIYVSDTNNHRIQKFDSNGTFMLKYGSNGSGNDQFNYPCGIVSVGDFLYVCDQNNHRICILYTYANVNQIGFGGSFGSYGSGDKQFIYPTYIAFDKTRRYLIIRESASANADIRIYNFISQWSPVFLRRIYSGLSKGLALDPYGNIVVSSIHCIQVVTMMGKLVREYGIYGTNSSAVGKFYIPNAVAVDAQGNIYVTEGGNHRVQIIEPASVSMHSYSTVTTTTTGTWSKIGGSIPCLTSENNLNMPVSLSGDGRIVAIGYPYNDGPNAKGYLADNNGAVRVFKYSIPDIYSATGRWNQLGNTIYGNASDLLGGSVSLSANGRTLAIGKGKIRHDSNVISNNIGYVSGTATGIAFDSFGTMWVGDINWSGHSIRRFSTDIGDGTNQQPINILYGNGTTRSAVTFSNPGGIVIWNNELMFFCDMNNHRIVRIGLLSFNYSTEDVQNYLSYLTIGSYGSADGYFYSPAGIATDSLGYIYVADTGNHRVQKLNSSGGYVSKFGVSGSAGSADGQFNNPRGIAIDVSGNIWVADTQNNRIQIFNSAGGYIRKFGTLGSANEQFNNPYAIALDNAGYVYIADYLNACIKKFTIGGTYVSKFGNNNYTYLTIYKNKLYASYNGGSVTVFSLPNTSVSVYTCPDDLWSKNGNNFSAGILSLMGSVAMSETLRPLGIGIMKAPSYSDGYTILVADSGNHYIRMKYLDPSQGYNSLGSAGAGGGQFNEPIAIAVYQNNSSSKIYIVDQSNHRIQIWGVNGFVSLVYMSSFGSYGSGNGQLYYPAAIAIHPVSGYIYVADAYNHRVQIFNSTGGYLLQFGSQGTGEGQFQFSRGIAFDASGNVYVVDQNNNRVQKFTSAGGYMSQFGSYGSGNGQFSSPRDIVIDANGYIYVSDFGNNRIQVFTSAGVYVSHVGSYGSGNGQFDGVAGMTIYNGILYAVDYNNKRIHLYSISNTTYSGDAWTKLGSDINLYDNVNDSSLTGPTVSLSGNGRCVAIGVNTHDGAAGTVADCGAVSVYKYSVPDMLVTNGSWAQLGDTLYGDAAGDQLGTSVAISTDGTIVAAGAPFNDGSTGTATDNRGKVIVRIYNSDTNAWTATSISGEVAGDSFGYMAALSSNGTTIVVGTQNSVAGSNWVKAYNLAQTDPIVYTSGNSAVAEVHGQIALSNSQGDAVISVTQAGAISSATMTSRLPVPTIFVNTTRTLICGYNTGFGYYSDNNCSTYSKIDYKLYHTFDIACNENGTRWVAVGYSSNPSINLEVMSYSNDGINWTVSGTKANFTYGLYDVKFNGTIWVALGGNTYYSYDGINWTQVPSNPVANPSAIAYNGNRWVVGDSYGNMGYSDNGINWTNLGNKFGDSGNLFGLACNGSRWIAVVSGPNTIMYSDDGIVWFPVVSSNDIFVGGYDVAYNPNSKRWVAVGDAGQYQSKNTIAYSDDNGLTWIGLGRIFNNIGRKIIWNKAISLWMAIGDCRSNYNASGDYEGSSRETVVYSSDGIVWTKSIPPIYTAAGYSLVTQAICSAQPNITYANINKTRVVMCGDGTNTLSYSDDGGFAWKGLGKSIFSTAGRGVAFNPSLRRWIAVGEGTNSLAYSSDGINWVPIASNFNIFSLYGQSVACNAAGTRWVAVGSGINSIAYSNDGIGWTGVGTSIFSDSGVSVACNPAGTRWIAVGYGPNRIAYSDNGIAWTGVTGSTTLFTTAVNDVACNADGTMWIAVGSGTNAIATSTDNGVTWTGRGSATFNVTTGLYGIQHNGSYWVVVGPNTWGSSVDGITWWSSTVNFFSDNNNNGSGGKVKWIKSQSKWLAVGSGKNNVAYSLDGYVFTASPCQVSTNCNGIAVWEDFNPMVAVGAGTNSIAYSYDGAAWTGLGTSIFSTAGYDVAWNGTRWVAVGAGTNSIAHSADGGITWTGLGTSIFSTAGNGIACNETNGTQWVAVGSGTTNSIAYSTDGMAWTGLGKDIFSVAGNGVGYNRNGNQWVAVGSGTNSIACSDNIITWTGLGTSIFSSSGNKVESNGNRWVAVGQGTNSIAYSNDGFAWYGLGTSLFSTAGYGVAWSGTQWVAVGQGTNSIAYSSNGITWTGLGTSIFSTTGYNVAWTGSRWVAVGQGTNSIAYSSDGIAWTPVASSSSIFSVYGSGVQFPLTVNHLSKTVGDSVSLSGLIMSKSPGAITYSISSGSNLATLRGSDVTITGVGTIVVVANQAATDMYAAASKSIVIYIPPPTGGGVTLDSNGVTVKYTAGTTLAVEPTFVLADPRGTGTPEMFAIVSDTSKSMITDYAKKLGVTLATLSTFGASGTGNGQFQLPFGIAIDASGNIYVVDFNNHRVQKFTSAGSYLSQIGTGTSGSADGQFNNPTSIAIDASGKILVADSNNHRIQVFTSAGTYLSKFGTYGSADGQFYSPTSIAIDASGNIYVVDQNNHRVQKFSSTGTYLSKFGTYGSADGQFYSPTSIAIDASGKILVADTYNHRIQVFTSAGTYVSRFGTNGTGNGQFQYPFGIAIDASGNIIVSDNNNNRIQVFTSAGTYVSQFNEGFYRPRGIAIDASGKILVVDSGNNRIQIVGPPPETGRSYFIAPRQSAAVPFNNIVTTLMTNMQSLFQSAAAFNQAISSWDTANVMNTREMFKNANVFNQSLNSWNTAKVTDMYGMFWSDAGSAFNGSIGNWNTVNVTIMAMLFYNNTQFNQPIGNWNMSNVWTIESMFNSAYAFNQPLNSWNTINVKIMQSVFGNATSFNQPIGNWNTSNVIDMYGMFQSATAFNQNISTSGNSWKTSNVSRMSYMFYNATLFNTGISNWDVSNVTEMSAMFYNARAFNNYLFNATYKVTRMDSMFANAVAFNHSSIQYFNTSYVTTMVNMFMGATSFNQPIQYWYGYWHLGYVKDISGMFYSATAFNQNINNWAVSNVTSMNTVFAYATSFNQPLGNWNTGNVTSMQNTFLYATSFFQDIRYWNVNNVGYGMWTNFYFGSAIYNNGYTYYIPYRFQ
ncbi:MAG: BspA family leucine-rich repeat surface protein, partial [Actinobacteria bacterium]|nr:BspA family leucine-rich repeat surface protein [Actinomycetota bacterium]